MNEEYLQMNLYLLFVYSKFEDKKIVTKIMCVKN